MIGSRGTGKGSVSIVGAGLAGLGLAALLAHKGYSVDVFEKNDRPGGRACVFEHDGFTFDAGPTWYMMPEVFERYFAQLGTSAQEQLNLVRLDPSYRIYFGPDDYVDLRADMQANLELFEREEQGAGAQLTRYLESAKYQYEIAIRRFLYHDLHSLRGLIDKQLLFEGPKMRVFENLDRYARRFFKSQRLRQILEYSMVFLGGSPSNIPALYSMLSHADLNLGVWYPMGGMGSLVKALVRLCEAAGVRIHYSAPVSNLIKDRGHVTHVVLPDGPVNADTVVINADYAWAETHLLDPRERSYSERYWSRRVMAPSALLMYLGLDRQVPGVLHHTLSFQHDWMKHFDAIFKEPGWPEEPSLYLCCPSKTDPSVVPQGRESLVVLVPLACGLEDDRQRREAYADKVLEMLGKLLGQPIAPYIVSRNLFGPSDFASWFNAYRGTALGLSHTLMQSAFLRPRHRSRKLKNLFYVGHYTHPGIGVPMALISAQLVAGLVAGDADGTP